MTLLISLCDPSFAGTGAVAVIICWFILPEVACRTAAEIDEMYDYLLLLDIYEANHQCFHSRFEKKINLRKFKSYSSINY